jgi:GNAT superfamily N-acetyltransferase
MKKELTIRTMTEAEMALAVDLAAREGWNPGLHDAEAFYRTDPEGFIIALKGDEPVGCVSAVSYGQAYGFIGFFIVLPEYRGGTIGVKIGERALERLAGVDCIGIDGVFAKVRNYVHWGFHLAYRNLRFETEAIRTGGGSACPRPVRRADYPSIAEYDRLCFPAPRERFLERWLSMPESTAICHEEHGRVRGYGVIRKCREGWKVGPLFADDGDVAEGLYLSLSAAAAVGDKVYLDVPECNEAALSLAKKYAMREVFGTARMYRGAPPTLDMNRVFGITSFELG